MKLRRLPPAFLLIAGALLIQSSVTASAAWDEPVLGAKEPFLEGTLTWQSGAPKGQILWGPGATSPGDNLPPDPRSAADIAGTDLPGVDARSTAWQYDRYFNDPDASCVNAFVTPCTSTYDATTGTDVDGAPPLPDDVFESEPLPRDVYVNVTRAFQVQLFLKYEEGKRDDQWGNPAVPCADLLQNGPSPAWPGEVPSDVSDPRQMLLDPVPVWYQTRWVEPDLVLDVRANGKLVGGAHETVYRQEPPADPAGYHPCYYKMVSEQFLLPKGSTITLTIHHPRQMDWYPYGLQGTHASKIYLWEYPPEELYYRFPELDPAGANDDEASGNGGSGSQSFLLVAAFALASPVMATRRQARGILVAAILLLVGASGCLSNGGKPGGDRADEFGGNLTNDIYDDPFNLSRAGTGSILGLVHDDLHIPISGVHVTVASLSDFAKTDGSGRFQFYNITPGTHRLRFDHAAYKVLEDNVEVVSGKVSKPTVRLVPKVVKQSDYRPHSHDYWNEALEQDLGTFTLPAPRCFRELRTCRDWTGSSPNAFRIPTMDDNNPKVILPGTAVVDITLTWEPDALAGVQQLGLQLQAFRVVGGHQQEYLHSERFTFAARGPGQTYHIQTTWEMTDNGHARASGWVFEWFIPTGHQPTGDRYKETQEDGYTFGAVHAKVKTYRGGLLPLEPPHLDHWGTNSVLKFMEGREEPIRFYGMLPPTAGVPPQVQCQDVGLVVPELCYKAYYPSWDNGVGAWKEKVDGETYLVPDPATWLEVRLTLSRVPSPEAKFRLYYSPGRTLENERNEYNLLGYTPVEPPTGAQEQVTKYRFKVGPQALDEIYTWWSRWSFTIRPVSDDAAFALWQDWTYYQQVGKELDGSEITYSINVDVHRDAWPG